MKLQKLNCPNCNGELNMKVDNSKYIFCPYCGQKFFIDDGKKERTINKNITKDITINKNMNYTHRKIDDADVIRAKSEAREKRFGWLGTLGSVLAFIALLGSYFYWIDSMEKSEAQKVQEAIAAGKIQAGFYQDYVDKKYEAVVEQFEILGFENISTVDLNDAGFAIWNSEKVESVSIGGDTNFNTDDYFDPNEKVIITYH